MRAIEVNLPNEKYIVYVGNNELSSMIEKNKSLFHDASKVVVIADDTVWNLYGESFMKAFVEVMEVQPLLFVIPSGEFAKTVDVWNDVHTFLLQNGCNRGTLLIAFGGGACGDLTGFVAATYMRGISYIQIPTTVLAHDSAVGGKTAINHPLAKNMIGAFHQPKSVIYDTKFFTTLPLEEYRSGFAELWKHAFLTSTNWLEELEQEVISGNWQSLDWIHHLSLGTATKVNIVIRDEKEQGDRQFLNFGHTLAHAIEKVVGYKNITHGEAVAIGIVYDLIASSYAGHIGISFIKKRVQLLRQLQYPLSIILNVQFHELFETMMLDKKNKDHDISLVLLKEVATLYVGKFSKDQCEQFYNDLLMYIKEDVHD